MKELFRAPHKRRPAVWAAMLLLGVTVFAPPASSDRFNAPRQRASAQDERFATGLRLIPDEEFTALLEKGTCQLNASNRDCAAFVPWRLPTAYSLAGYMPPAEDQGGTTMCVGHCLACIKGLHEAIEELWDARLPQHRFSAAAIYNQLPHGPDGGASIVDGLELLKRLGANTLANSSGAGRYRIYSYHAVNPSETGRLKSLLAGGIPIAASVRSIPALHRHRGDGVLDTYDAGPHDGYHALTIVGYDDRRGCGGAFLVQNSWGRSWGDGHGRAWISYTLFTRICRQAFYAVDAPNG